MNYSPHQLAFFAHQLTRRAASSSMEAMAGALLDAQVDLNPHQIDAAMFATSNPLSKGVILADEVGLGKTIEAGLLIAQRWAERKRRILVITPANLRKQWHQELADKFGLPATIFEAKSFRQLVKEGAVNPFNRSGIIICSYQFAARKAVEVKAVAWDLVVIDEAHRLRNVYKPENKTARALQEALSQPQKVLLTATPLQNSLLELYGLVSFIDERVFGDLDSFKSQFGALKNAESFDALKNRIAPICKRTLRRQVEAYVKYTKRIPLLREFTPSADETALYNHVTEYLEREALHALPNSQRQLITLVLRKLLASSISQGFVPLKPCAFTAKDDVKPLHWAPDDKRTIGQYLYGGFMRCAYPYQKFHSDTERILATVLERQAKRWFRPASGQFNIYYRSGASQPEYIPDFVAQLPDMVLLIETKKAQEVAAAQESETDVKAKAEQATIWCRHASDYAKTVGGKPWKYLLVPHDAVAANVTLENLVARYGTA